MTGFHLAPARCDRAPVDGALKGRLQAPEKLKPSFQRSLNQPGSNEHRAPRPVFRRLEPARFRLGTLLHYPRAALPEQFFGHPGAGALQEPKERPSWCREERRSACRDSQQHLQGRVPRQPPGFRRATSSFLQPCRAGPACGGVPRARGGEVPGKAGRRERATGACFPARPAPLN